MEAAVPRHCTPPCLPCLSVCLQCIHSVTSSSKVLLQKQAATWDSGRRASRGSRSSGIIEGCCICAPVHNSLDQKRENISWDVYVLYTRTWDATYMRQQSWILHTCSLSKRRSPSQRTMLPLQKLELGPVLVYLGGAILNSGQATRLAHKPHRSAPCACLGRGRAADLITR